ncbi:Orotate phosphoribosyltransferase [Frankliniella fusca]|uniref:Orotate phosphoribosyltransferase n=1 Tax=Frankliniella fusca TaxID=407009 RepID=A0AAE1HCA5_9NEOP|nr:Orotate phosphoribosyltransferase [Frankliniella fusca]
MVPSVVSLAGPSSARATSLKFGRVPVHQLVNLSKDDLVAYVLHNNKLIRELKKERQHHTQITKEQRGSVFGANDSSITSQA